MRNGGKGVYRGPASGDKKADCTLTLSDEDFIGLATGQLNGQQVKYYSQLGAALHCNCIDLHCTCIDLHCTCVLILILVHLFYVAI